LIPTTCHPLFVASKPTKTPATIDDERRALKIQIFSDLHGDVAPIKKISVLPGVDVVVVAGDTCEGAAQAFDRLRAIVPTQIPIVTVLGNHEYYRRCIPDELAEARSLAAMRNIYLLENDSTVLLGVRFIGATLWTDYCAFGEAHKRSVMTVCADTMNDHRLIRWQKKPWLRFRPQEAAALHHRSKTYFEEMLSLPFDGPTVMVTHHAVHWQSIDAKYRRDLVTGAFVSDLSALIEARRPALWIHGHVHDCSDYRVGETRMLCNPHGYGEENAAFDGALVVEVGT
jgi:Icc-related predicted phosphoesterase